jgi:hypothetical protein
MMRIGVSLIGVALLGLLGCHGSKEATSVEQDTTTAGVTTTLMTPTPGNEPTPEEQLMGLITSCRVRRIVFLHGGVTYVSFREGKRARVRLEGRRAERRVFVAASEQRCPDSKRILIGIE